MAVASAELINSIAAQCGMRKLVSASSTKHEYEQPDKAVSNTIQSLTLHNYP
jgi:hypothetical protein